MCSPFVLAKRDHLISSPFFFFVNIMHSSATPVQVPRSIQCQTSGRRTRGRTLSGGRVADGLRVEIINHELVNFVT